MESFTHDGYQFDVTDAGPADGTTVILLHGFPEDRESWAGVTPPLNAAGYRTLTFDQRGYSSGARPTDRKAYRLPVLAGDVLALAEAAGTRRFHLVGHDWGASLAWYIAAQHPDRLFTVTALSVPPAPAMRAALTRSTQAFHSWYMLFFQLPRIPERTVSAGQGRLLRRSLMRSGLDEPSATRYGRRAAHPDALTGPINWYRALRSQLSEASPPVTVPALYVWGDHDGFVSQFAAEAAGRYVSGPFRFETLTDVSHWIPEVEPERTARLLLEHLSVEH